MLFQQTYFLFLRGLLIVQTQYRNMDKGCEKNPRQGKDFRNFKLRRY